MDPKHSVIKDYIELLYIRYLIVYISLQTKPLAHTPQIIAQFASLNLNAPSNMSEVGASVEQLQARKVRHLLRNDSR